MLKRCYLDLGVENSDSCYSNMKKSNLPYALTEVNGMLEISKIKPGQNFTSGIEYESTNCQWYPLGKFDTTELKDVPFTNQFVPREAPTTTEHIEANYATLVNYNFLDKTEPLMIKIEDYHSEKRFINIKAKLKVVYTCELEFQSKKDIGCNALQIAGQASQLTPNPSKSDWELVKVPTEYYNFNCQRLLAMHKVG